MLEFTEWLERSHWSLETIPHRSNSSEVDKGWWSELRQCQVDGKNRDLQINNFRFFTTWLDVGSEGKWSQGQLSDIWLGKWVG